MLNKFWIWHHFFHCGLCPKLFLVCIRFSLICAPIDGTALDIHIKNKAICRSNLKIISKLRDQISLRWQLTSVHSKFVSTEIIWQSKIKGRLFSNMLESVPGYCIFFKRYILNPLSSIWSSNDIQKYPSKLLVKIQHCFCQF